MLTMKKTNITEIQRSKLLRFLGEQNFNYSEVEKQKVEYVYRWLVNIAGTDDFAVMTLKIREVQETLPKDRHRLNQLYTHVKLGTIRDSGRYDITTKRPPQKTDPYDSGWRL